MTNLKYEVIIDGIECVSQWEGNDFNEALKIFEETKDKRYYRTYLYYGDKLLLKD